MRIVQLPANFKTGQALAMSVLLTVIITGCTTSKYIVKNEEVIENRNGAPGFALRFPAGVIKTDEKEIARIVDKTDKFIQDQWILARYHHLISSDKSNLHKAKACYVYLIENDKSYKSIAANNLACIYCETGDYRKSERLFQEIINGDSRLITAYYNLNLLYKFFGRSQDSINVLMLMKERFPENIYALIELGDMYFEDENYTEAEKFYNDGLNADAENPVPIHRMAKVRERLQKYKDAQYYYERCIKKFPYFQYAYIDYSNLLIILNQKEKARDVLNKGLKMMEKQKAE